MNAFPNPELARQWRERIILGEGGVVRGRSKSDSQSASLRFAMAKPQNAEPISSLVNNAG
ncbi:hypothetical protein Pla100_55030 [Neorhodopirellula pilleata]|uniref:Uncharacterized protein n=1 Tax=Neorhodopirellula pilleata TaxID=2714738 RepID=A0A5C5ZQ11_9BACT|nr:hypothetical protein Pla100_55030 [Neorhodopirellula pilleata]